MSWARHGLRICGWLVLAGFVLPAWGVAATPHASSPQADLHRALDQAQDGHLDAAFLLAERAAAAEPDNRELLTVREVLRQRAAFAHLERAHTLELARQTAAAAVEYQLALSIAPGNDAARAGLAALFPMPGPVHPLDASQLRVERAAPPVQLQPVPGLHAFHLRASLRRAVATVTSAYGMTAYVDNAVPESVVQLDLGEASFADAMAALRATAGLGYIPLDAHSLYFTDLSRAARVEPLATRTFYLPRAEGATDLTQIAGVLKALLGIREITPDAAASALSLRATPAQLDAAEQLLLDLGQQPAEVVLQFRLLSLSSTAARDLGLSEPIQFTMFALGPLLKQLQQSGGLQQNILNLFQQGGLAAVLQSGMLNSGALSQFQSQISPLLQNPFVTFGGGATLMAVSVPALAGQLSATQGRNASIETALLRARSGQSAELKIGQRYPVINASFSPISLSPAISQEIAKGGFVEPFPSFTYEDLGLDAKVTPDIGPGGAIHLKLDLAVKALTGQSNDSIPILSDRHVVTAFALQDNEPLLIAGLFTQKEMNTLTGLPGLAQLPGLGHLFSASSEQSSGDQMVLEITAHVVRLPPNASAAIGLPASFAVASSAGAAEEPSPGPSLVPPGPPTEPEGEPYSEPSQRQSPAETAPVPPASAQPPTPSPSAGQALEPIFAPPRSSTRPPAPRTARPSAAK